MQISERVKRAGQGRGRRAGLGRVSAALVLLGVRRRVIVTVLCGLVLTLFGLGLGALAVAFRQ